MTKNLLNHNTRLPPYEIKRVVSTLSQVHGWGIKQLNVPDTWKITQGEGINIMVIDTGYTDHPDLEDGILKNRCKSFLNDEPDIDDHCGHSSHIAGIIAARNNDMGIVGVAPKCNIITVKVLGADGTGTVDAIINALKYAKSIRPHIVSMSLGTDSYDKEMHDLIKDLYKMNIPVVAAAGNDGRTNAVNYPGKFPEVICITAYDKNGIPAKFNSTGPEVGFSAPGVDIYSTWLNHQYCSLSGTSMACPFCAGLIALLLAKHIKQEAETGCNDCKTVDQIREHLIKYSDKKGIVGKDETWGYGIPNPSKLILEIDGPISVVSTPVNISLLHKIINWFCGLFV